MSDPTNALGQAPQTASLDLNSLVTSAVQPIAAQIATDVATGLHTQSLQLIGDLTSRVAALEPQVAQALADAGGAVLHLVETDTLTQRVIAWTIVGAAVLYAGVVLIAYLAGNPQAAKIWASGPAAIGAAVLWVSNAGTAPKSAAKPTV